MLVGRVLAQLREHGAPDRDAVNCEACGINGVKVDGDSSVTIFQSPGWPRAGEGVVKVGWRLARGVIAEGDFDFRAGSGHGQRQPQAQK